MGFLLYSTPHSPGNCLYHCLSPTDLLLGLLGPAAWGGFKSVLRNSLQTDPSASPYPEQTLGGQLMFLTIPPPPPILPPFLPAGPLALLGITASEYEMPCGDLLSLLVGGGWAGR